MECYCRLGFNLKKQLVKSANKKIKIKKAKVVYAEKKPFLADKEIIFRSNNRAMVFNISHRLQVFVLIFMATVFSWSGYNYYFYHIRDKQLDETRDAYMDLMSDVSALQNNLKEVMSSLDEAGDGLHELQNYRKTALAVEDKLKLMADSENWIDQGKMEEKITTKEALLQKNLIEQENNSLRLKMISLSDKLENLQKTVKGLEFAEVAILEKIEKMSGKEIEEIKKTLDTINQALKGQKQYFNPLANIKDGQGGEFIPLDGVDISKDLQDKMSAVFQQIEKLDKYKTAMSGIPLGKPVYQYRLSSTFGTRSDPFNQKAARHKGIDMSAALGSRISAPAGGRVIEAGYHNGYGNLVTIRHTNGFTTKYAHLNKIYVKKGQVVKYNQAIGEVGRTGRATGSHLHYEVLYNGVNVNPLTFVNIQNKNKS